MNQDMITPREFTIDELAAYNGTNGKPAYVAINGVVHDMSQISAWRGGTHFGLNAGNDLSPEFVECHEGMQLILDKLPLVGILMK